MNTRGRQKNNGKGKHYKPHQVGNLDFHMAADIASGLRQFRRSCIAVNPALPEIDTIEKWHASLDDMIWAFEQISNDYPDEPYNKAFNKCWDEKIKEDKGKLSFASNDDKPLLPLTPELQAENKVYYAKIKENLHKFAEYYMYLWD